MYRGPWSETTTRAETLSHVNAVSTKTKHKGPRLETRARPHLARRESDARDEALTTWGTRGAPTTLRRGPMTPSLLHDELGAREGVSYGYVPAGT